MEQFKFLTNANDGVVIVKKGGDILFWNIAQERITGISATEAKSQKIWHLQAALMPNLYADKKGDLLKNMWLSNAVESVVSEKANQIMEFSFHRMDGSIIPVEQYYYSFSENENKYFIAFTKDISERKIAENKRRQTEEAARLSDQVTDHNLRSPLNAIYGLSDSDLVREQSDEKLFQFMDTIHDCSDRMLRIIKIKLLIAQIERGNEKLEKQNVSFFSFLESIKKEFLYSSAKLNVKLKVSFDYLEIKKQKNFEINIEETLFQSLLINLLINAAEASPIEKREGFPTKRKDIELAITLDDKNIYFSIHNFGEVPKEIRNVLFQKYVTHKKEGGNGLGLYSALLIAEAHNGNITYISENGETSFTVSLPI